MRYLTFAFCWITLSAVAQLPNFSFEHISNRDGLPSNIVNYIAEDKKGFLLLATRRSLARYDGYTFKNYESSSPIWGVDVPKDGDVYFSTDLEQLLKIDSKTGQVRQIVGKTESGAGNTFCDSRGNVWFANREGVYQYNPTTNKTKAYPIKKTTYIAFKGHFLEDKRGNVWVLAKEVGLYKYDQKSDKLIGVMGIDFPRKDVPSGLEFNNGFIDKDGILWAATFGTGLLRYDTKTDTPKFYEKLVYSICEGVDNEGRRIIWVGDDSRIGIFRPEQEKFYYYENLLPDNYAVNHIFRSPKTGIVWFSTSEGVLKYNPHNQVVSTHLIPPELKAIAKDVTVIHQDKADPSGNTFWIGLSRGGILRWNRAENQTKSFPFPAYSPKTETTWIIQDKQNKIWIGANQWQSWADGKTDSTDNRFEGIFLFDPSKEKFLKTPFKTHQGFFSVPFYSLGMIDHKDRFWITNHYEGMRVLDLKTGKRLNLWDKALQDKLIENNNWIMDVFQDSRNRVWIATMNGVYYYDESTKTFKDIEKTIRNNTLKNRAAIKLTEDKLGNIWAVGWHLVAKIDKNGKILGQWSDTDGLPDMENRRIVMDAKSRAWIGSLDALTLFDESRKAFRKLTVNDGLISNNTMGGFCMSSHNELLVGNRGGWNAIKIDALDYTEQIDNLAVSSIKVNNKEIAADWSKEVRLERDQNSISFDFSALNFAKNNENRYSYYLEGFETGWIDGGNNHQVYYTNLNPKSYVFHVRTANAFGKWNEKELTIRFSIKPAYYETWWFRLLIVVLVGALAYGFYRYRINQLLQMQAIRENISRDLHDEIGASLSGIGMLSQIAVQQLDEKHPSYQHVRRITEDAKNIGASMDDIVWSINPKNDEIGNIIARMNRHTAELFEAKGIEYQMDIQQIDDDLKLSMEQRRDIYLVFKEGINNLLKYSKCKNAKIGIRAEQSLFEIMIEDDGAGFDTEKAVFGNGLRNMRKRAEALKGDFKIESAVGRGTKLYLRVPI